jgi:hypothetical protein
MLRRERDRRGGAPALVSAQRCPAGIGFPQRRHPKHWQIENRRRRLPRQPLTLGGELAAGALGLGSTSRCCLLTVCFMWQDSKAKKPAQGGLRILEEPGLPTADTTSLVAIRAP